MSVQHVLSESMWPILWCLYRTMQVV